MLAHNAPHCANEGAPLQAPPDQVRAMRYVQSPQRRIYAAMVKKLDDSVGEVFKALYDKGILDNTIIVFISDNGGITSGSTVNYASNFPLRGLKLSPFEGGVRVNGLIWSRNLTETNHVWKGYMHVVDWTPTLLSAVGSTPPKNIDGIDHWESIVSNKYSKRNVIYEIDDYFGFSSVISDDFKLHTGTVLKEYSNHQGKELRGVIGNIPSYTNAITQSRIYAVLNEMQIPFNLSYINQRNEMKIQCTIDNSMNLCYPDINKHCLYNIKEDPCETEDLSIKNPQIVEKLNSLLKEEMKRMVRRRVPLIKDLRAKPTLHNNTWTTWADNIGS
ncbi:arylsulfatase J-like [Leptidea sinapis]|uniref:arylsulfatase J-like n=1 Tax=Leptidea sinapis TaxID=189913 RepID=UPI0021C30F40|nr:arylsulfatase J-like [Leptidea sinapis]